MPGSLKVKDGAAPAGAQPPEDARVEANLHAVLDALDARRDRQGAERRKDPRFAYRRTDLRLRVTHPGGGTAERGVMGRDISARGAAVLHEGFLHVNTRCHVVLRRRLGGQHVVFGRVRACRHVLGAFHLISIHFDEPIAPRIFIAPDVWGAASKAAEVDPAALAGNVVMLDDQEIDRSLI